MRPRTLRISPVQYGTSVNVELGDGPALLTGTAGWSSKQRTGQSAISAWQGRDLLTQDVPILLDGFAEDRSVEFYVDALRIMAGIGRRDFNGDAPTAVKIHGPINYPRKWWVINEIEQTEVRRLPRNRGGNITYYAATLKLIEYVGADQIRLHRRKRQSKPQPVFYTVVKGDTLARIAQKLYGDRTKWKALGKAQQPPIRDPRKELKPGRKLRIPGMSVGLGPAKISAGFLDVGIGDSN